MIVIILPYGKLQKFPSSRANQCNSKSDFSNQEFIFHISGVSDEERLKYLNEDNIEEFVNSSNIETFPICKANQNCYNERINNTKNVIKNLNLKPGAKILDIGGNNFTDFLNNINISTP